MDAHGFVQTRLNSYRTLACVVTGNGCVTRKGERWHDKEVETVIGQPIDPVLDQGAIDESARLR
jgi:hypothetical protein